MITSAERSTTAWPARQGGEHSSCDWRPLAAGAVVGILALSKRSTVVGLGALAMGGYLVYRAASTGKLGLPSDLVEKLGWRTCAGRRTKELSRSNTDWVDETSMESFPASDPPANY